MLSIPHMIVVFLVVLVVFGPHKLPELARGLGKLMAEFRKASTDFRTAFEEEMRDLERQARETERRKAEAAAMNPTPGAAPDAPSYAMTAASAAPAEPAANSSWVAEVHEHGTEESASGEQGSPETVARTPDSILPAVTPAPELAPETPEPPAAAAEGGEPLHGQRQPV
ncbi:MAG: twin-arginine translocase TatA/TatE family subunit [Acidobacteriia bacterium]|nr:twin-arginine translocase TatA/TatE family subunit [Terriglobia bacterium]